MNDEMRKALEAAAANGDQGPGVVTYIVAILFGVLMIAAMLEGLHQGGQARMGRNRSNL